MGRGLFARRVLAALTVVAGGFAAGGLVGAGSAQAAALPDLKVTIEVSPVKSAYAVGDAVTTTFVITNAGDATATHIQVEGGDEDGMKRPAPLNLTPFNLAPGATKRVPWAGVIDATAINSGYAFVAWAFTNDAGEANAADNTGRARIPVPGGIGKLRLKAFIDNKGDYDDRQPGLADVTVVVTNDLTGVQTATGKTGADGYIQFDNVAPGEYRVGVTGWKLRGDDPAFTLVQVKANQVSEASLAVLPGSGPTTKPTTGSTTGSTTGPTHTDEPSTPATTSPNTSGPAAPADLAKTGSSTGPLAGVGIAVLVAGAAVTVAARRRRTRRFVA
jgi:uncharacterized protein (TIGR04145 family)